MKILIADNVRSLHNIGSLFRSCECFGIDMLLLCGISATPPRKEITKTALGAEKDVNWKYFKTTENAITFAKEQKCKIIGIELTEKSKALHKYKVPENYALIVGHEVMGVDENILETCDDIVEIPMKGIKTSLNVSVATGVALHYFTFH